MVTNKKVKTIAEALECAADLIEEKGLARGSFRDFETGAFCAVGAIRYCTIGDPIFTSSLGYSAQVFLADSLQTSVFEWNDNKRRKPSTIINTLRKVAKKAAKEGR